MKCSKLTTTKIVVFFFLVVVIISIAIPVILDVQSTRQRTQIRNDLKQIMVAMHNYHDDYQSFPPAFVIGPDGKRWHSWRALLLPYIDQHLASQYHFDEPWNGIHNTVLLNQPPEVFRSKYFGAPCSSSGYFAIVGRRTMWPADQSIRILDITDGTSNTLAIVEDSRTDTSWLEPRDLLANEFVDTFRSGHSSDSNEVRFVATADGAIRTLHPDIDGQILASLLTPSYGKTTYVGNNWPDDLKYSMPEQKLNAPRNASGLPQTEVVAVASAPLSPDSTQLWSAAFQLTWEQLKQQFDGPVKLQDSNPTANLLNVGSLPVNCVSSDALFQGISDGSQSSGQTLVDGVRQMFPDVSLPLHQITEAEFQMRLVSVIRKQMPFESAFTRFNAPLGFISDGNQLGINSFGHDPLQSSSSESVYIDQVIVLDDRGDTDFVIQLNTNGLQKDQIILAMEEPQESLLSTWDAVKQRIGFPNPEHKRPSLQVNETLQIPILDFSVQNHFTELEGQLLADSEAKAKIDIAFCSIQLRLDETGADFLSVGELAVIGEFGPTEYDADRIRRFIVNRPFFVAIKEPDSTYPYFMGWVANSELMEPFSE